MEKEYLPIDIFSEPTVKIINKIRLQIQGGTMKNIQEKIIQYDQENKLKNITQLVFDCQHMDQADNHSIKCLVELILYVIGDYVQLENIDTLVISGYVYGMTLLDLHFKDLGKLIIERMLKLKILSFALQSLTVVKLTDCAKLYQRSVMLTRQNSLIQVEQFEGEGFKYLKEFLQQVVKKKIYLTTIDLDLPKFEHISLNNIKQLKQVLYAISDIKSLRSFSLNVQKMNENQADLLLEGIKEIVKKRNLLEISLILIKPQINNSSITQVSQIFQNILQNSPDLQVLRLNFSILPQIVTALPDEALYALRNIIETVSYLKNIKILSTTLGNWIAHPKSYQVFGTSLLNIVINNKNLEHLLFNIGCDEFEGSHEWLTALMDLFLIIQTTHTKLSSIVCILNNQKSIQKELEQVLYQNVNSLIQSGQLQSFGLNIMGLQKELLPIQVSDFEFIYFYKILTQNYDKNIRNLGINLKHWTTTPEVLNAVNFISDLMVAKKQYLRMYLPIVALIRKIYQKNWRKEYNWDVFQLCFLENIQIKRNDSFTKQEQILEI